MIVILVLILVILFIIIGLIFYIRNKIRDISMKVFNTPDIMEGFKEQEIEYENTPKSLSSLDSVLIPRILEDFPNMNIEEMRQIAENSVRNYYNSLNKRKLIENKYNNNHLNNMILERIEDLMNSDIKYDSLKIHRTVINAYNNKKGSCVITFQMAIQYYYQNNKKRKKVQDRVNVDLIYIYDEQQVKDADGVSLNCPNCGAPIRMLGIKTCPYCSTGIVDFLTKTWRVNNIYQK